MDTPAFASATLLRQALQSFIFCVSVIVILLMAVKPAQASGTVAVMHDPNGLGYMGGYDYTAAACGTLNDPKTFSEADNCARKALADQLNANYGTTGFSCANYAGSPHIFSGGNQWLFYDCNGILRDGLFLNDSCPSHSVWNSWNGCDCKDPYVPDATKTSCVSPNICPVPPLTVLTDPVAISFDNGNRWHPEGLTPAFQQHLACVQNAITAAGGTYAGTSAYRPTQYQQHLYEIIDRDFKLSRPGYMNAHPECQALRDEVTREMGPSPGHALKRKQKVATPGTSRHESGTAFDLTPSGLTDAQLAPIYAGCGVTHTAVRDEPWHTQ